MNHSTRQSSGASLDGSSESDSHHENRTEEAFCDFHTRAFLAAYREHNEIAHRRLARMGLDLPLFPSAPPSLYDLRLETIKESHPWDETIKEAAALAARRDE